MKYRTTRYAVAHSGRKVFQASYGALQGTLRFTDAESYTAGLYGWNFDVYNLFPSDDYVPITICTGYRNMPGREIPLPIIKKYEARAEKIAAAHKPWKREIAAFRKLAQKLADELAAL